MQTAEGRSDEAGSLVAGFQNELELLRRHIRMLEYVERHGPIGIIRLSTLLGVPKHKVRYSLRILEQEGYIQASTQGATATPKVTELFQRLPETLASLKG
jgi:predicted transcriptional regulator